jgi:hypothetical protein
MKHLAVILALIIGIPSVAVVNEVLGYEIIQHGE